MTSTNKHPAQPSNPGKSHVMYLWREKRGPAGKQLSLIDAHGKEVAFVQQSFMDWFASTTKAPRKTWEGKRDWCIEQVERFFGIEKAQKTGKQGELF